MKWKWERRIGKRWLFVGIHRHSFGIGFHISQFSIDIDLLFIYIGLEL